MMIFRGSLMFAVSVAGSLVILLADSGSLAAKTGSLAAKTPLPTMTPMVAVTPVFSGKAPNMRVQPVHWPCSASMVKGNKRSKLYHVPTGKFYSATFSDVECFANTAAAKAAGFGAAK